MSKITEKKHSKIKMIYFQNGIKQKTHVSNQFFVSLLQPLPLFETHSMKYQRFLSSALLATFLCAGAPAQAQNESGSSADEIVNAGLNTLKMLDDDRIDELWINASAFVKTSKSKDVFVQELRRARATVGAVQKREWAGVIRIVYPEGSSMPPAGLYANLDVATYLKDGRTMFEKVSFRLEPNGWQLTGYEPRQTQ